VKSSKFIFMSSLFAGAIFALAGCGGVADDGTSVALPQIKDTIDENYIRNVTVTLEGGAVTHGEPIVIAGEFELVDGAELPATLMAWIVGSTGDHERMTFGTAPIYPQLIEGNRYSFTAELMNGTGQRTGQVELQITMSNPVRYGKLYLYREPLEVLAERAESAAGDM
jgi:hypothetical protein